MQGILLIAALAIIAWFWWDNLKSKELARQTGKQVCDQHGVQFLDDTVEKKKIWLQRNSLGRFEICRLYGFEFATDGAQRYRGKIVLQGKSVSDVEMDAYRIVH